MSKDKSYEVSPVHFDDTDDWDETHFSALVAFVLWSSAMFALGLLVGIGAITLVQGIM